MGRPELSIVIPAYNEEGTIRHTLEAVAGYLEAAGLTHEVIVVDDGSTDRTAEIVEAAAASMASVRLLPAPHEGKGGAVQRGILASQGRRVLFMDADHSTPIEEWGKCLPWLQDGYEVVIGSRKVPEADVRVRQPFLRELMGKGFTWLTNAMLGTRATDITCGFKGFQAEAARRIFRLQRMKGWGFDAEILFIARRLGYRMKEVPVIWINDSSTKVRLVRDTLGSFTELVQIRLGGWRGHYSDGGP